MNYWPLFLFLISSSFINELKGQNHVNSNDQNISNLKVYEYKANGGLVREVEVDSGLTTAYIRIQELKGNKARKKGWVGAVDILAGNEIWRTETNDDYIWGLPNLILNESGDPFISSNVGAWCLDKTNGQLKWRISEKEMIVHPNGKVLLSNDYYNTWSLYSSETGKPIWSTQMKFSELSNLLYPEGTDHIWGLDKGIHMLDLEDGDYWYEKIRGIDLYETEFSAGRGGIIAGSTVMFGLVGALVSSIATSGMSSVGSRAQNYLIEGDQLYIVGDEIQKYNPDTKLVWSFEEAYRKRGVSALISLDSEVLMLVDYGFRYNVDGIKVRSGMHPVNSIERKAVL